MQSFLFLTAKARGRQGIRAFVMRALAERA
jgi:hypothetical protein